MSHFAVAVFSETQDQVEQLLAPFQENNMGDCPKKFLKFVSTEEEHRQEYSEGTVTKIKTPDGQFLYPWDERFRVPGEIGFGSNTHQVPEGQGYEKVELKFSEVYPTFEEYIEDFCGDKKDSETGQYGYWENPNKKWDYWGLKHMLRLKNGERASSAQIKDVDFSHDPKAYQHAIRFWEINVEGQELKTGEETRDYFSLFKPEYYIERYGSKEEYADKESAFSAWAFVTPDGKWHEQGEMGWFCANDATADSTKGFMQELQETIEKADPASYIATVDCHI